MSSAAVSTHSSGAGALSLMSCVRDNSLPDFDSDTEKIVATKKKFWSRIKWFKKKHKASDDSAIEDVYSKESLRSRSTSELSINQPPKKRSSTTINPGLSVSHDSVFHSPYSGSEVDLEDRSLSTLSIPHQPQADIRLQTELTERLRHRRGQEDASEDDEGLPLSLCNSPTVADTTDKNAVKDLASKSYSTCSDGSLLSMCSSDLDEDGQQKSSQDKKIDDTDSFGISYVRTAALNHSAAHHRVAVRPKRNYGVPRRKRVQQIANVLPTTPEVNEDNFNRKQIIELLSYPSNELPFDNQLKCSSLPPGLVPPDSDTDSKLLRTRSNVGSQSEDTLDLDDYNREKEEKIEKSFFERLFPRRSAKKRKAKEEKRHEREKQEFTNTQEQIHQSSIRYTSEDNFWSHSNKTISAQTVNQFDTPYCWTETKYSQNSNSQNSPSSPFPKQKSIPMKIHVSSDSEKLTSQKAPPNTIKVASDKYSFLSSREETCTRSSSSVVQNSIQSYSKKHSFETSTQATEHTKELAEIFLRQKKILTLNEDEIDNNFKSLTELPNCTEKETIMPRSHSFKTTNSSSSEQHKEFTTNIVLEHKALSMEKEDMSLKSSNFNEVKSSEELRWTEQNHENDLVASTYQVIQHVNSEDTSKRTIKNEENNSSTTTIKDPQGVTITTSNNTVTVDLINKEHIDEQSSKIITVEETRKQSLTKGKRISITKIESKDHLSEFLNKQLNKVEPPPSTNVVFSTSPRIVSETVKIKKDSNCETESSALLFTRKFSTENVEIVNKDDNNENVLEREPLHISKNISTSTISSLSQNKSSSMESITSESPSDKSSQDSLNNILDRSDSSKVTEDLIVFRDKTKLKSRKDDEPELMKVFARRSLKLKDSDDDSLNEQQTVMIYDNCDKESDKEDQTETSVRDRRKLFNSDSLKKEDVSIKKISIAKSDTISLKSNSTDGSDRTEDILQPKNSEEDIVADNKRKPVITNEKKATPGLPSEPIEIAKSFSTSKIIETGEDEVILRKPINNIFNYQKRMVNMNFTRSSEIQEKNSNTQTNFQNRRKTEAWLAKTSRKDEGNIIVASNPENENVPKQIDETIIEKKNFNERKAVWEKWALEAQKK